jgi:hypothetical protein
LANNKKFSIPGAHRENLLTTAVIQLTNDQGAVTSQNSIKTFFAFFTKENI